MPERPPPGVFGAPGPRWFSIPSGRSFLDDLAAGLAAELGGRLSEAQILTPTRRGARAMAQAFGELAFASEEAGGAILLPQIRAIGDLEDGEPPFDLERLALDLPAALSPLRRRFELARLVLDHYRPADGASLNTKSALEHADVLAGFFDSLALEEIDARDRLDRLIHDEGEDGYVLGAFAEHWQVSARFLALVVELWPARLAELGLMDPSQRQVALLRRLCDQWTERPPEGPAFLVGSTGTAPSMADLMGIVAGAPQGAVVLPGLDHSLSDAAWRLVEDQHPQGQLKRLLTRHGLDRSDVRPWSASRDGRAAHWRRRVINEALRPAAATNDWLAQITALEAEQQGAIATGLNGLTLIEAAHDEQAAAAAALIMRETLETPEKTVALITPDMTLARRVSARLTRWGVAADSSAGQPLSHSPVGQFLNGALKLWLDPCDMVSGLGWFRHPHHSYTDQPEALDALELRGLRGAKPVSVDFVSTRLETYPAAFSLWASFVQSRALHLPPPSCDLKTFTEALIRFCEASAKEAGQVLWAGAAGASASAGLSELMEQGEGFALSSLQEGADILERWLTRTTVRTGGNTHPRLFILGALEARLVKADKLILAGLEEGTWPQAAPLDPFLSRPMRTRLGLPSPERRTGLSAHDFVQAVCAPEVVMITRKRSEGEPRVASRWVWRLQTLCKGAGVSIPKGDDVLDWAAELEATPSPVPPALRPAPRPAPTPPLSVRPKSMSVTEVERFARDPYAIYARRVLGLKKLDRPHEPFEAMQRGTAIHKAAERFALEDKPLGTAGRDAFAGLIHEELLNANLSVAQMALQIPFIPDLSEAYVGFEEKRRADKPRLIVEASGQMQFEVADNTFTLKAKADRLELREEAVDILDFKTGTPPSVKQVLKGYNPQLTLTAAILRSGGFEGVPASKPIGDMLYVTLSADSARPRPVKTTDASSDDLAAAALDALKRRLTLYANPKKPYLSWTAPLSERKREGDYDHLARFYEWQVLGDGDDAATDADSGEAA